MGWRVAIVEIFMPLWDERIQFQDSSPPVCVFERWDVWTRWKCASNHRDTPPKKRFKSFINVNQFRIISCFRLFHTIHWSVTGGAAANDRLIICSTDSDSTELTPFTFLPWIQKLKEIQFSTMKDEKKHQIHQMFDILVKTQYTNLQFMHAVLRGAATNDRFY